jgi:hypothetical protein
MRAPVRTIEDTRYKEIVYADGFAAYGAKPLPLPVQTVNAAVNMHKPVFFPCHGGEGSGFYHVAIIHPE